MFDEMVKEKVQVKFKGSYILLFTSFLFLS